MDASQTTRSPARSTSLRRRWNRTFTYLIAFLVASAMAGVGGTALLVGAFRDAAVRAEREGTISAGLRADVIAHAVAVANAGSDDHAGVVLVTASTRADFTNAIEYQRNARAKEHLVASFQQWEALVAITTPTPTSAPVDPAARGAEVTGRVPPILAELDEAGSASRAAVRADVASAANRVREAMAVLVVLGGLGVALALRMARRLSTEVLRPVGVLRDSANHLAAGELDHRIVVDRDDELGDLAVSFNAMADAVAGSHRSLALEARTDSLSGLANRTAFRARLEETLARPERRAGTQAVLFVDLDDFKDVNDSLGHDAGDALLCVVAQRLSQSVRPGDLVARLGGDEFAILLEGLADASVALTVAERIVVALSDPVDIAGNQANVGASVGMTLVVDDSTVEELMREADVAMYAAKAKGKNRVERYDAGVANAASARQALRSDVIGVAHRGELVLDYQPVIDFKDGNIAGLEALVRWQHPTRGLLPPSEFIDLAEATGAIISVGAVIMDEACQQLHKWQRRCHRTDLWISVNVSVIQLDAPNFAEQTMDILRRTGVHPANLLLEVTESVLIDPAGGAAATLSALRRHGVRVALDDFGTGYSSLSYLRELPVDVIKIDRSFVSGTQAHAAAGLLEAIVTMAKQLNLGIIPEGIETNEQLVQLIAMGCDQGQGFLLSRPVPSITVNGLLTNPKPWRFQRPQATVV